MPYCNYRIGIVGVGDIALQFHLPALQLIDNCRVVSLCDTNPEVLTNAGKKYNVKALYKSYKEMIEVESLDIIIIASPNMFHAEHSIYALNKGVNVLVEKPFSLNYHESAEMLNAAKNNKRSIMCLHHNRFKDCSTQSKKIIDSKKIGDVFYSKASILLSNSIPNKSHYLEDTNFGGGPLYDIGYHLIDIAWWLMGKPKPSYVLGKLWHKNKNSAYKCEDFAIGNIFFEDGKSLFIEVSYSAKIEEDNIDCTFFGSKGSLSWPKEYFYCMDKHDNLERQIIKMPNKRTVATVQQIKFFLNKLEQSGDIYIEDSSTVVKIIENIIKSSNKKKIIYF